MQESLTTMFLKRRSRPEQYGFDKQRWEAETAYPNEWSLDQSSSECSACVELEVQAALELAHVLIVRLIAVFRFISTHNPSPAPHPADRSTYCVFVLNMHQVPRDKACGGLCWW